MAKVIMSIMDKLFGNLNKEREKQKEFLSNPDFGQSEKRKKKREKYENKEFK